MPYPDSLRAMFSYQRAAALTSPSLVSFDCAVGYGFYGKYIILMALPPVCILASGVLAIAFLWVIDSRKRRLSRVAYSESSAPDTGHTETHTYVNQQSTCLVALLFFSA